MIVATNAQKQIVFARHLVALGRELIESRSTTLSREAIEQFRAEVAHESAAMLADDSRRLIRVEAVCLVAMLAELTYARSDKDRPREKRLAMLSAQLVACIQSDIVDAQDAAMRGLS